MGEVYLAEDLTLNRKVAIKFLLSQETSDPASRKRLLKEAQAAAHLDHPNICTIHEVDERAERPFIVMQFVEGETLAARLDGGRLELSEACSIALQIAEALAEAHDRGIIHRDLKPQNIMLTPRGQAKLMDFGLAKMSSFTSKSTNDAETRTQFSTVEPMMAGTVPYMSPEQVRGLELDARSDIFSFGTVFYEMLSGKNPFRGQTTADTITQILTQIPPSLAESSAASAGLDRIVEACLAKDRTRRFQSARDVIFSLKNLGGTEALKAAPVATSTNRTLRARVLRILVPAVMVLLAVLAFIYWRHRTNPAITGKPITSLAVLPLANNSGDPNNDYLSDGVTESIIDNLTHLSNLKVIARTTVFRYKGKAMDPQKVGRELGVDAVLTGYVNQMGGTLIIQTDLINVSDGTELGGERYTRRFEDIFQVQEEIAQQISDKLRLRLTGEEQHLLSQRIVANPVAYQLYLKGQYHLNRRTPEDLTKSIEFFQQAAATDSHLALASAGLADAYNLLGDYQVLAPRQAYPKAEEAAAHALQLDDMLAEAHTALAHARLYEWDWRSAQEHYQRALALKPGYATAHQWYANYLMAVGRTDQALAEIKRALELDPLSLIINSSAGWHLYLAKKYDQVIDQQKRTLDLDAHFIPAHAILGMAWAQQGKYAQAISEFKTAVSLSPGNPDYSAELGRTYALSGDLPRAQSTLNELLQSAQHRYVSPYSIARVYAALKNRDEALLWLNKAIQERNSELIFVQVEPDFAPLHSDPRFIEMIKQMGFPAS